MAWNGSGDTGRARTPSAPQKKSGVSSPLWLKGALAGLVVVAIGAAVLYMMRPANKPTVSKKGAPTEKTSVIKEATPVFAPAKKAGAPTAAVTEKAVAEVAKPEEPKDDVGRAFTNSFGKVLVVKRVIKPSGPTLNGKSLEPRRIFKNYSECVIDSLMNMEPGDRCVGGLSDDFEDDFAYSLENKIEVTPEDTPEEAERKRQMIVTKEALVKQMKETGKTITQIVQEARAEMNKIATIRDDALSFINDAEDNGADGDELEDTYAAANKMLEKYGVSPLLSPVARKARARAIRERKLKEGK